MVDSGLSAFLRDKYNFTRVEEVAKTSDSTVYAVGDDSGWSNTLSAEVEVFTTKLDSDEAQEVRSGAGSLDDVYTPAVVKLRDCSFTNDGHLVIVRDKATGTLLREVVQSRKASGNPLGADEVQMLLLPIADAIDIYAEAGKSSWLMRSVNVDNIQVYYGQSDSPTKLTQVGPVPGHQREQAQAKRATLEALAEVIEEITWRKPDTGAAADAGSAVDYLQAALAAGAAGSAAAGGSSMIAAASRSDASHVGIELDEVGDDATSNAPEEFSYKPLSTPREDAPRRSAMQDAPRAGAAQDQARGDQARGDQARGSRASSQWAQGSTEGGSSRSGAGNKPVQHFPETDPGFEAVVPHPRGGYGPGGYGGPGPYGAPGGYPAPVPYGAAPGYGYTGQYAPPQYAQPEAKKKDKNWPWVLATVLIILGLAGGGGYYWYVNYGPGKPWEGAEAALAAKFPNVISEHENQRGPWQNTTCTKEETQDDEKAKIICRNETIGVSIVDFGTTETRDSFLPDEEPEPLSNDNVCFVDSYERNAGTPTYTLAPLDADKSRYLFTVYGDNAEKARQYLRICG
ncbi:hypothetical protein [Corynebacterium aquatimens]|uniref:Serine/threonine protein kinase n=1 Tax=Corynebacterium aquatimens TaxID=1190508 RepID=A0A931GRT8_9CORY|nr:hypothetical protein [Corynebacterium aquatimens]MBG6122338.1 hypothetical protein [Corynebacterium aquatimens]WJY65119.1 hypothetical protein CAQUA_01930 [Corynebacterium aquatimens]